VGSGTCQRLPEDSSGLVFACTSRTPSSSSSGSGKYSCQSCQGTTPSPLPIPILLRNPVPIPEVHLPVPNSAPLPHLFRNSYVRTASEAKRAAWYATSKYRGVKANIASEYRAMALAAVEGVYCTGSLAVGILRLFSLDSPLLGEIPPSLCTPYCLCTLDFPSASLCDCMISTASEGCPYTSRPGRWVWTWT
jgi:hypothetical protein